MDLLIFNLMGCSTLFVARRQGTDLNIVLGGYPNIIDICLDDFMEACQFVSVFRSIYYENKLRIIALLKRTNGYDLKEAKELIERAYDLYKTDEPLFNQIAEQADKECRQWKVAPAQPIS